jgi:hypothetical protein
MTATEIRSAVDQILSAAGIAFKAQLVGETIRDNNWKCDAWRVSFGTFQTDYFTGTGHRKPVNGAPTDKGNPNTLYREDWEKRYLRPVAPKAADVLHSLIMDMEADSMSFRDWCDNYGYSDDSLTALDTYRACCKIAEKMRATFKPETLKALREAVQDL